MPASIVPSAQFIMLLILSITPTSFRRGVRWSYPAARVIISWYVVQFGILLSEAIEFQITVIYDDSVDTKHNSRIATCKSVCVVFATTRVHKMTSCRSGKRSLCIYKDNVHYYSRKTLCIKNEILYIRLQRALKARLLYCVRLENTLRTKRAKTPIYKGFKFPPSPFE